MELLGDTKYDLSKLMHSSIYGYDYLIANKFSLIENTKLKEFNYKIEYNDNYFLIKNNCLELINYFGYKKDDIIFLTSLLFLSMASLHEEDSRRQLTMYLHGLSILNEQYKNENMPRS